MPIIVNVNSATNISVNLDYATEEEAIAGVSTTKVMTPYRTKQSITANIPSDTIQTLGTLSTNTNIDIRNGKVVTFNLGATVTLTLSNPETQYGSLTLIVTNPATQYSIVWPSTVKWNGNAYITIPASSINIIKLITVNRGASWLADITYSAEVV